jgi:hypothetical protein
MNAREVRSRLFASLSYRTEIRTQRTTSSMVLLYLLAYVNTHARSFLCFSPKMNVKVFCGTTNTTSLLEKWTPSVAAPVTRDLSL